MFYLKRMIKQSKITINVHPYSNLGIVVCVAYFTAEVSSTYKLFFHLKGEYVG